MFYSEQNLVWNINFSKITSFLKLIKKISIFRKKFKINIIKVIYLKNYFTFSMCL